MAWRAPSDLSPNFLCKEKHMSKAIYRASLPFFAAVGLLAQTTAEAPAGPQNDVFIATAAGPQAGTMSVQDGPIAIGGGGIVGITSAMMHPAGAVTGAPYSAQTSTQQVQMLADGNRIEQTTSGSVARDSQGRIRRDESLPAL